MFEIFNELVIWIEQNPQYAGWVIFSMALAESLAIVGMLIPGVVILFAAGTLIGAGVIDFWSSFAFAAAGAVIGDGLSYWLGHHYENATARWPWFRVHPEALEKGVRFFDRYGDLSVAAGRFFGPIRAVVPLIAGLMRMPPKRFYTANILSALVWAPAYLLPGMIAGAAVNGEANWYEILLPAAAVVIILVTWFIYHKLTDKR